MRVRAGQELATGLLFILIGAGALYIGADYPMGTPQRPGTGVLPKILSWCLIGTGGVLLAQAVVLEAGVFKRALPIVLGAALAAAAVAFGAPMVGAGPAWAVVPAVVGFLLLMDRLVPGTAWRPLIAVTLATVAFGLTIDGLGLIVAMVISLTICALGTPETRWPEYVGFLLIMIALAVGTFIWLLGMPIPVWPVKVPDWLKFLR
jgi:hypothetical protein